MGNFVFLSLLNGVLMLPEFFGASGDFIAAQGCR